MNWKKRHTLVGQDRSTSLHSRAKKSARNERKWNWWEIHLIWWTNLIGFVAIKSAETEVCLPPAPFISSLELFHFTSNFHCFSFLFFSLPFSPLSCLLPSACCILLCLKRNHFLFTNYIKLTVNIYGHIKIREFFSSILFVCFHQHFFQCFWNSFCMVRQGFAVCVLFVHVTVTYTVTCNWKNHTERLENWRHRNLNEKPNVSIANEFSIFP